MATFMKDPKYHDSIEIVPLKTTIILAAEGLAWSIMSVGYNMMESAIAAQAEQDQSGGASSLPVHAFGF